MKKYGVFVAINGYIEVEAETEEQAREIVEKEKTTGDISWNEDWDVTDIQIEEE